MTAILSLFEILVELAIALRHLLLAELIAILLLFQYKQQILLTVDDCLSRYIMACSY
jgi:hypothetical protein